MALYSSCSSCVSVLFLLELVWMIWTFWYFCVISSYSKICCLVRNLNLSLVDYCSEWPINKLSKHLNITVSCLCNPANITMCLWILLHLIVRN